MTDASITTAIDGDTCVIRFDGDIRHTLAHGFDRFLDRMFDAGAVERVIVDLTGTTNIDSTMLGLMARLASDLRDRHGRRPLLFSPNADINELLDSLCLDECFVRCDELPSIGPGSVLPEGIASDEEHARLILDAHRLLARMNEGNRALFESVIDALERELPQR